MKTKKTTKKERNDIRVTDIPDAMYKIIKKKAKENDRTLGKEIIHQLKPLNQ